MGRAEDLLNGLQNKDTNNEISLLIAGENTDTEPHFIINDNRVISVPSELRTIAVQYDHNIETVTFDCPRYWDGHDMSKMVVYINYERADGETGAYLADNVRVDDEDESIMHFEWTISRNVTSTSGSVTFLVCVKSVDKSGDEQEHWNSERCSDISVAPGLETGEPIEEKYPDVLTQLSDKYDTLNKAAARINDATIGTDSTYSSQKIENLVETVDTKVSQANKKVEDLETDISELSETVGSKANQSDLTALQTKVNSKADTSTVNQQIGSLKTELSNDISELDSALDQTNAQVALKTSINDSQSATGTTYSSQKIEQLVSNAQTGLASDISELETSVTELSGDLTVLETRVNDLPAINDSAASATSLYSSQKIENLVETVLPSGGEDGNVLMKKSQGEIWGKVIDDTQPSSTTTTLSASGVTQALDTLEQTINGSLDTLEAKVDGKPNINDTASSTTSVYSSDKVDNLLNEISTGSGSVPPGGTAGQVLRKSSDNSIIEWSTIIDDSKSATSTTYSSSKIDGLVGAVDTKVSSKANQSDLTALQGTVSTLQTTVGTKADTATVTELSSKVDSLEETVETKAGINDSQTTANNTWSAQKIQNQINLGDYVIITKNFTYNLSNSSNLRYMDVPIGDTIQDDDVVFINPRPVGTTQDTYGFSAVTDSGGWLVNPLQPDNTKVRILFSKSWKSDYYSFSVVIFRKKGQ